MKVIFLDRDGTINYDEGYTYKIKDFKLLDNVVEGLLKFKEEGFKFVIVSNQSGIGRGLYSENEMKLFNDNLKKTLSDKGIEILGIYFCPHVPKDCCICRKPNTGLFSKIIKDFPDIEIEKSFMIGDKFSDIEFGNKIGVKSIWLSKEYSDKHEFVAKDLIEATRYIY
jgi:D-glycero-D-manno-heptose 1,7-bisphosphate phosphatase